MNTINTWLSAHPEVLVALAPLYVSTWALVLGWLSKATARWPFVSKVLHVLALSPAPHSAAEAEKDVVDALK